MHPLSELASPRAPSRALLPARRRLSAPWMLTLLAPSFHVGAGRAFTGIARPLTLFVAPRHRCRLLFRAPADAPYASLAHGVGFHRESQGRPTVPPSRGPRGNSTGRWRNDPERLLSYRLPCELTPMRVAFQPRGPSVLRRRTQPRIMPPL